MVAYEDAQVGTLNMLSKYDQRLAVKSRRWDTDPEFRAQIVKALHVALKLAVSKQDVRDINATIRNAALLEGQNQTDEHLAEKNARLNEGAPTEIIATRVFEVEFDDRG